MGSTQVDPQELYDCGNYYLNTVSQNFLTVRMTAEYEGCNSSGFDSLAFFPIRAFLDDVAKDAVAEAFTLAQGKMVGLGESLIAAAKAYGLTDEESSKTIEHTGRGGHIAL